MGEHHLAILHVSDLHYRADEGAEGHGRRRVLGKEWVANIEELLAEGPIDLIAFTGDIAHAGKAEEYALLTGFVDALVRQTGVDRDRLFVVPGNHDTDRSQHVSAWQKLRELVSTEAGALSRWMAGGRAPPRVEPSWPKQVIARQAAYRAWVRDTLRRPELLPGKPGHPWLGYRVTLAAPRGAPFPVHVIGLDSAWLAGDDNDALKLALTTDQVKVLSGGLDGLRIALVHHPLAHLADGADCRRLLAERVDLLLRGHEHKTELSLSKDPDHELRELAAGCLYEHDGYPNACQRIDLTLDDRGRVMETRLRFRAWSKEGFWCDDATIYKGAPHGRWVHPPPAVAGIHLGVETLFVGRANELERMEAALLPEGNKRVTFVALNGMPGVGKSYLADRFAHLHEARFPGGYVKLSLPPAFSGTAEDLGGEVASQLKQPWTRVGSWNQLRACLSQKMPLIHVENVDAAPAAFAVGELLRGLRGCAAIVSGRSKQIGHAAGWCPIEVLPMNEDASCDMLAAELGRAASPAELADRRRLVAELGHLPLALHLAAGRLRVGTSVGDFLARLRALGLEVDPMDGGDELRREGRKANLRGTFELSLEALGRALGTRAAEMLAGFAALGHAPPSGVGGSLGAAMAGLDEPSFGALMEEAVLLSVVARVPKAQRPDGAWSVHPLLAELLRRKGDGGWMARTSAWFVERMKRLDPGLRVEQGKRWQEVRREHEALVKWLGEVPVAEAALFEHKTSKYARFNGPFSAWMTFCERLLAGTEDRRVRSGALWTLCHVAESAGDLDVAERAANEKRRIDLQDDKMLAYARATGGLANILEARGRLQDALRLRQEEELPRYHDWPRLRAMALRHVAAIFEKLEQPEDALRVLRDEVLAVFARSEDDEIERAGTQAQIARVLLALGQSDEALRMWEEALQVLERLGDGQTAVGVRVDLALLYLARGRLEDRPFAAEHLRLALRGAEGMDPLKARIRHHQKRHGFT